jgi:hypothetical protein
MNTIAHHASIEVSDINARLDLTYWQKQLRIEAVVRQAILKYEQQRK